MANQNFKFTNPFAGKMEASQFYQLMHENLFTGRFIIGILEVYYREKEKCLFILKSVEIKMKYFQELFLVLFFYSSV